MLQEQNERLCPSYFYYIHKYTRTNFTQQGQEKSKLTTVIISRNCNKVFNDEKLAEIILIFTLIQFTRT